VIEAGARDLGKYGFENGRPEISRISQCVCSDRLIIIISMIMT